MVARPDRWPRVLDAGSHVWAMSTCPPAWALTQEAGPEGVEAHSSVIINSVITIQALFSSHVNDVRNYGV